MSITVFNSRTGKKEPLQTVEQNQVKIYVCGITAYDYCHIGHARSVLVFDMIVKYLKYSGYKVTYIRNFTDIDDKIIMRANERKVPCEELSEEFIRKFHEDMDSLGVAPPTREPKATEHIPEIIDLIQVLIDKEMAYQVDNDVYYRVEKFKNYGMLSGRNLDDMLAGARISIDERKENPMDFALWKGSKEGEPTWDSPWGPGRPGWHIECSAMSRKYLGDTFDIHGGGKDLAFPHHENEVAQSEGATGKPFVKYWVHNGFVTIKDEKMSKSLGNFLTIREVLENYHQEVLRLFVFSTHYRNPLDYSEDALNYAVTGLDRIYASLAEIEKLPALGNGDTSVITDKDKRKLDSLQNKFTQSMDNDFNTAQAVGHIFDAVKDLNRIRQKLGGNPATVDLDILRDAAATIKELCDILGIAQEPPAQFIEEKIRKELQNLDISREKIEQLIVERTQARQEKNWARSDEIRDLLLEKNIELKDGSEGTTWQVKR